MAETIPGLPGSDSDGPNNPLELGAYPDIITESHELISSSLPITSIKYDITTLEKSITLGGLEPNFMTMINRDLENKDKKKTEESEKNKLTTKTITKNGEYNASDDNADGYSSVTVNVEWNFVTGNISAIANKAIKKDQSVRVWTDYLMDLSTINDLMSDNGSDSYAVIDPNLASIGYAYKGTYDNIGHNYSGLYGGANRLYNSPMAITKDGSKIWMTIDKYICDITYNGKSGSSVSRIKTVVIDSNSGNIIREFPGMYMIIHYDNDTILCCNPLPSLMATYEESGSSYVWRQYRDTVLYDICDPISSSSPYSYLTMYDMNSGEILFTTKDDKYATGMFNFRVISCSGKTFPCMYFDSEAFNDSTASIYDCQVWYEDYSIMYPMRYVKTTYDGATSGIKTWDFPPNSSREPTCIRVYDIDDNDDYYLLHFKDYISCINKDCNGIVEHTDISVPPSYDTPGYTPPVGVNVSDPSEYYANVTKPVFMIHNNNNDEFIRVVPSDNGIYIYHLNVNGTSYETDSVNIDLTYGVDTSSSNERITEVRVTGCKMAEEAITVHNNTIYVLITNGKVTYKTSTESRTMEIAVPARVCKIDAITKRVSYINTYYDYDNNLFSGTVYALRSVQIKNVGFIIIGRKSIAFYTFANDSIYIYDLIGIINVKKIYPEHCVWALHIGTDFLGSTMSKEFPIAGSENGISVLVTYENDNANFIVNGTFNKNYGVALYFINIVGTQLAEPSLIGYANSDISYNSSGSIKALSKDFSNITQVEQETTPSDSEEEIDGE